MNCLRSKIYRLICCLCAILFIISCEFTNQQIRETKIDKVGIYYNRRSGRYNNGLQYVILTKDSLYANVLHTRDSVCLNINRWHQPYHNKFVLLDNFVPIGIQWKDMVCFLDRDSNGNVYGKDSVYVYQHGIIYESYCGENYLFYDPDQDLYTFYKTSFKNLQKKGVVPSRCKSMEDVEKYLCLSDSCVFEGIRKMSKSELMTILWGE
mgnify:CR=1 FL=1